MYYCNIVLSINIEINLIEYQIVTVYFGRLLKYICVLIKLPRYLNQRNKRKNIKH